VGGRAVGAAEARAAGVGVSVLMQGNSIIDGVCDRAVKAFASELGIPVEAATRVLEDLALEAEQEMLRGRSTYSPGGLLCSLQPK
jgi:hypothetical protein